MKAQLEGYIQEFTRYKAKDIWLINWNLETTTNFVERIQRQNNNLVKALESKINAEEVEVINNEAINLIPTLDEFFQSCNNLLVFLNKLGNDIVYTLTTKVTNDNQYYFWCKCY